MKNIVKTFGIIAFIAVIGFLMASCPGTTKCECCAVCDANCIGNCCIDCDNSTNGNECSDCNNDPCTCGTSGNECTNCGNFPCTCGTSDNECPDCGSHPCVCGNEIGVNYINLTANGSESETTNILTISFNKDISGFDKDDITFDAGSTGAIKGELTKLNNSTGIYELAVSGISSSGNVTISWSKEGYIFNQISSIVYITYSPLNISFTSLTSNGSSMETTTMLVLTFSQGIDGFDTDNITLNSHNVGGNIIIGELVNIGAGVYELEIDNVTANGPIEVTVNKNGYNFNPSNRTVDVQYAHPGTLNNNIVFDYIYDENIWISVVENEGMRLFRVSNSGPTTLTLSIADSWKYERITWRVNNTDIIETDSIFILDAANNAFNFLSEHFLTVTVWKDGIPFSHTTSFKIDY
ncbi:MAG: hypothetical protein FWD13_05095 [Treponema sp.]|nr:hypothetical protein [Treponema sp.]